MVVMKLYCDHWSCVKTRSQLHTHYTKSSIPQQEGITDGTGWGSSLSLSLSFFLSFFLLQDMTRLKLDDQTIANSKLSRYTSSTVSSTFLTISST